MKSWRLAYDEFYQFIESSNATSLTREVNEFIQGLPNEKFPEVESVAVQPCNKVYTTVSDKTPTHHTVYLATIKYKMARVQPAFAEEEKKYGQPDDPNKPVMGFHGGPDNLP